ncbi:hypothetical protein Aph01nite_73900 [Acrocarpospora phusangensis]|uniref:Uncharacterized protein n=1 Tax=Acrocarpospora phusangensis TaxID=1070424 RepID=A0A919QMP4_9ACTN|nr:hypothetical protein [Acrocarpospora phusangensis]GIH29080.1 hypothetical protein Aph01nite_73900 [Acrocarpospora phusangensis]
MQTSTTPAQASDAAAYGPGHPVLVADAMQWGPWHSQEWGAWLAEHEVDAGSTYLFTIHQVDEQLVMIVHQYAPDPQGRMVVDPDTGDTARKPPFKVAIQALPPLDCHDVVVRADSQIVGTDENGWVVRRPTGVIEFSCSCGITGRGPREETMPQANLHWERTIAARGMVNGARPSPR